MAEPRRKPPKAAPRLPAAAPVPRAASLSLWTRWLENAVRGAIDHGAANWAASIAYYSLLSLFPLVLVTLSIASHFVEPAWAIRELTRLLGVLIPEGSQFVRETVEGVLQERRTATVLSVVMLLWAGGGAFRALSSALSAMYGQPTRHGFWKGWVLDALLSLVMGSLLGLALAVGFLLDVLAEALNELPHHGRLILRLVDGVTPPLLLLGAYYLTYRFIPRRRIHPRSALSGAGVALLLFLAARPVFALYVRQFARWNLVYGPLAIVIGLLFWAWVVALITLFGGEVAAQVEGWLSGQEDHESSRQSAATPPAQPHPKHAR